jgi:hypothetical protein
MGWGAIHGFNLISFTRRSLAPKDSGGILFGQGKSFLSSNALPKLCLTYLSGFSYIDLSILYLAGYGLMGSSSILQVSPVFRLFILEGLDVRLLLL